MANPALATAYVQVMPSFAGFRTAVEKELGVTLGSTSPTAKGAGEKAGEAYSKGFAAKAKEHFGKATADLKGMLLGAFAGVAIASFVKDSVAAFSEVQDASDALRASFGSSGEAMIAWAKESGDAFNLSQAEALKAAQTFAIFGESAGQSGQQLERFSTTLSERAADAASYFGGTTAQAIEAFSAALRGESEPIRRYGVLLDDATLRAKALELGLVSTTTKALTPQQRVLAAYNVVMEQTARVQGDVARTSDSMGNTIKDAQQKWADLQAQIGQFVAVAAKPALQVLGALMTPLGALASAFTSLPGPIQNTALAMAAFAAASKLGAINAITTALTGVRNAVTSIPNGIRSLATAWEYAGQAAAKAHGPTATFSNQLAEMGRIVNVGGGLKSAFSGLIGVLGGPWGLALAGATLAITSFAQAQANAAAIANTLASEIDAQTLAFTELGRKKLGEEFLKNFSLGDLEKTPFTLKEIIDAAAAGGDEFARFKQRVEEWVLAQKNFNPANNAWLDALMNSVNALERDADGARAVAEASKAAGEASGALGAQANAAASGAANASAEFGTWASIVGGPLATGIKATTAAIAEQQRLLGRGLGNGSQVPGFTADPQGDALVARDVEAARKREAATKANNEALRDARKAYDEAAIAAREQFLPAVDRARNALLRAQQALEAGPQSGAKFVENQTAVINAQATVAREEAAAAQQAADELKRNQQAVASALSSFNSSLTSDAKSIASSWGNVRQSITDAFGAAGGGVVAQVQQQYQRLLGLSKDRETVLARLADQQSRLDSLRQQQEQTVNALRSNAYGSVTSLFNAAASGTITTPSGVPGETTEIAKPTSMALAEVRGKLAQRLQQVKKFAADLRVLAARGLPQYFLNEIISAGIDEGGAFAAALASANDTDFSQIKSSAQQLYAASRETGQTAGSLLYDAGISSAKGLIDGLKSQEQAIAEEMLRIADLMTATVRRALGIQSPSRVFAGIGANIAAGLVDGVTGSKRDVERAVGSLVSVPTSAYRPAAAAYGATSGRSGGFHVENITVNNPSPEPASTSVATQLRRQAFVLGGAA